MMFLLAAAAVAATLSIGSAPTPPVTVQATATVRIISGVRLRLDSATNANAPKAHDSVVTTTDGLQHDARLIEFE